MRPPVARSLPRVFQPPGVGVADAYQLGILFASPVNQVEHHLYLHVGYRWALGGFELANILLLTIIVLLGQERKGRAFVQEHALE